jgi:hypothetical protein
MKISKKILLLISIVTLFALALPGTALAAPLSKLVVGDTFTLDSGEVLDEDLHILGGTVFLEDGSLVDGDILLVGGTLEIGGEVTGDITATGGIIRLEDSAVIQGDVITAGALLDRDKDAIIQGEAKTNIDRIAPIPIPGDISIPNIPNVSVRFNPFMDLLWFFFQLVLWALVALLVVMLLTKNVDQVGEVVKTQPVISGAIGLLTIPVATIVLVIMAITIILIPVSLTAALVLFLSWAFGLIVIGTELGKRLAQIVDKEWHPALSAGLGTFVLMFVLNGLGAVIDCVGWIAMLLVGAVGLGAVLLTLFGTRSYPPGSTTVPDQLPPSEPTGVIDETTVAEEAPLDDVSELEDKPAEEEATEEGELED